MKIQIVRDDKDNREVEEERMLKCSFCVDSSPKGKCRWSSESIRADHCRDAIASMVKAFSGRR